MDKPEPVVKKMIILRGLPGSGKSTLARQIVEQSKVMGRTAIVCSADDYFMVDGKYVYRKEEQGEAHKACQMSVDRSLANGYDVVIVDNTNVKLEHMRPYVEMAKKYDYKVRIDVVGDVSPEGIKTYLARQVHEVPKETVERFAKEFER